MVVNTLITVALTSSFCALVVSTAASWYLGSLQGSSASSGWEETCRTEGGGGGGERGGEEGRNVGMWVERNEEHERCVDKVGLITHACTSISVITILCVYEMQIYYL